MPDTMLPIETAPAQTYATGIMDGYRSESIGKLVLARAKASAKIKSIIKTKKAEIPNKNGGRGFAYQYADLAGIFDAIEEAISEQCLAIIQTTQARTNGTYLITTLAHESDQWIAAEIRLKNAEQGPQVYGSELTYLRRYAVLAALALAPESDDDGKAAQEVADRARQSVPQRPEPPRRPDPEPASIRHEHLQAPMAPTPTRMLEELPEHLELEMSENGRPMINRWVKNALTVLDGKSIDWRMTWLNSHAPELGEVRHLRPDLADRVEAAAISVDEASVA
jgi:hypothetical protein